MCIYFGLPAFFVICSLTGTEEPV